MQAIFHLINNIVRYGKRIVFSFLIVPDYVQFRKKKKERRNFSLKIRDFLPCLGEKVSYTSFDRHYVYHTAWAMRKVKQINPFVHIDVASSLYFCSLLSAFVPVKFYDYRPPALELDNLKVEYGDLLNLPFKFGEVKSLSCMHTIEHIGLGRYGDSIDPEGDKKAMRELARVIAPGGSLLFVVPVGKPKIIFNAHRIYSFEMIREMFTSFLLREFSLIPERKGGILVNASAERVAKEKYGCGCFWFIKQH